jgi:hypothetical protein
MLNQAVQHKDIMPTVAMPKTIQELLSARGSRLSGLQTRTDERAIALAHVRAALPGKLAGTIVSAGLECGRLTISVAGAPWAARLRYATAGLKVRVGQSMNAEIHTVRIRVAP